MKVAIRLRVSTEAQRRFLKSQEEKVRNFCKRKGWEVIKVYPDVCSKEIEKSPEMRKAINESEGFDKLVAVSLDRFGTQKVIYKLLPKIKCAMVSIKEDVDSKEEPTAFRRAVMRMDAERMDRLRRIVTQEGRKMKGYYKSSYGFTDGIPDERIGIVRRIFVMYLYEHKGVKEIASELNKMNVIAPESNMWGVKTIWNILKNEIYVEEAVNRYEFDRVQKRRKVVKGGRTRYPLEQIAMCKECKERMYLRKDKYYCKSCKKKVEKRKLEKEVEDIVIEQIETRLEAYDEFVIFLLLERLRERIGDGEKCIRNFIPVELEKKVWVGKDKIEVEGLSTEELMRVLEDTEKEY